MPIRRFSNTFAAPWLMQLDDGQNYLVKFAHEHADNSIVGEVVCNKLADKLDLPVVKMELVEIEQDIIDKTEDLRLRNIRAGTHFATLYVDGSTNPPSDPTAIPIENISNVDKIPGMIVFDAFVCNNDRKAANSLIVPIDDAREKLRYLMIDHGLCFDGNNWNAQSLQNLPTRLSVMPWNVGGITGPDVFNPIIEQLNSLEQRDYEEIINSVPTDWARGATDLSTLATTLVNRDADQIINVLAQERDRNNMLFPNWR